MWKLTISPTATPSWNLLPLFWPPPQACSASVGGVRSSQEKTSRCPRHQSLAAPFPLPNDGVLQGGIGQLIHLVSMLVDHASIPLTQTGSSAWRYLDEYPKGLATADLDGDRHVDWLVSRLEGKLVFAYGRGDGTFDPVQVVETPASSFRQLIAVDLNGDGRVDPAGCDPFQGILYLFTNKRNPPMGCTGHKWSPFFARNFRGRSTWIAPAAKRWHRLQAIAAAGLRDPASGNPSANEITAVQNPAGSPARRSIRGCQG